MVAINAVADKAINRKPWVVSSFVPFYSLLTGGMTPGSTRSLLLPLAYGTEFVRGASDVIEGKGWDRMRRWTMRYHMPSGTQASRTVEGLIAISRGGVSDTAGRQLFEVDPDDWFAAITKGPYGTKGGTEYIKRRRKSRGLGSEFLGFGLPDPRKAKPEPKRERPRSVGGF